MNVSLTLSDFSVPWPWRATVISLSAHPLLWKCESVWDDKRFSCRNKFYIIFELLDYSLLVYSLYKELLLLILKKPALVFPPLAHFRHKVKLTFDLSNLASMSKKCRGMGARVSKTTVIFKCPDITTLRDQYRDRCDTLPLVTFLYSMYSTGVQLYSTGPSTGTDVTPCPW